MAGDATPLSAADRELLERIAARVVELRLETAAILAIETARPLSLVAGQALVFFEPLVQSLLRLADYRRFATLVERRDALEALVRAIETHTDRRDAARDAERNAARARRNRA